MSEMVENIAKAIRLRDSTDEFAIARAAIKAMRDLPEDILDLGVKVYDRDEAHMSTFHCLGEAYRAMIDEALK
jgi:hypothetical protein